MPNKIIEALREKYAADISAAKANIQVYCDNPAGIGDHPDLVSAVDAQVEKLCDAADKLGAINKHFPKLKAASFEPRDMLED